jgi:hypothetical protein
MRGARQRSSEPAGPVQRQSAVTIPLKEVKPKPTYVVMEPSDIADLVIYFNSEYARANELCAEADATIKRQQRELAFLRERNTHLESSNRKFQASNKALNTTIATRNSSVNQKSAQLSQSQHMLKLEQEKGKTLRVEILESQMAVRRAECGDLYDGKASSLWHHPKDIDLLITLCDRFIQMETPPQTPFLYLYSTLIFDLHHSSLC